MSKKSIDIYSRNTAHYFLDREVIPIKSNITATSDVSVVLKFLYVAWLIFILGFCRGKRELHHSIVEKLHIDISMPKAILGKLLRANWIQIWSMLQFIDKYRSIYNTELL